MIPKLWPYSEQAQGVIVYPPTFSVIDTTPGVANLPSSLVINGSTVAPDLQFFGKDAVATGGGQWPARIGGITLALAGNAPTYNNGSPFTGTDDDSILWENGIGQFSAANATPGDITTNDFFIIGLVDVSGQASGDSWIAWKYAGGKGFEIYTTNNTSLNIYMGGASTAVQMSATSLTKGLMFFCIWVNRDENSNYGGAIYANTVLGSGVNCSAMGSLTSAGNFTIGRNHISSYFYGRHHYLAIYQKANWFAAGQAGFDECANYAKKLYSLLGGTYPSLGSGSLTPATYSTRSTLGRGATLRSGVRKWYEYATNFPIHHDYDNGRGLGSFRASTNLFIQSDINSTWTGINRTADTNLYAGPEQTSLTARSIIGDATDGEHGVTDARAVTAARHCVSVMAAKGDKNWLYIENSTVANCWAYFNLATGVVGSKGAGCVDSWILDGVFANGFYWVGMSFLGTAATHTFKILAAEADGDKSFAGDTTTKNVYLCLPHLEIGDVPTPPIKSEGSATARTGDCAPAYKLDDGNWEGKTDKTLRIEAEVFTRNYSSSSQPSGSRIIGAQYGGGSDGKCYLTQQNDGSALMSTNGPAGTDAGSSANPVDLTDGTVKKIQINYEHNNMFCKIDGAKSPPDTSADVVDTLNYLVLPFLGDIGIRNIQLRKK